MSVVAPNQTQIQSQQPQSPPSKSTTNAHFYDLLHGKNASKNTSSSILNDMLASAQQMTFSDPVGKNAIALGAGVREIAPGPRSPKANGNSHATLPKVNGHGANGNGNGNGHAQEDDEDDNSDSPSPSKAGPSKLIGPVLPSPSSRKGKEPASAPTPRKERVLYEDPINLNWPDKFKTRKSAAAGLYNPSMACYANATLQVLLHTPPVLRIAQSHDSKNCRQRASKGWCMLCALKQMVDGDHWASKKAYAPREVHNHLNHIKKGFSKSRQEDTHEFFRFVTDALQNTALCGYPKDLPAKVKHTTWVYQTWGGQVRSRVVCSKCKKPSDTFDNFLDLSLDMPKNQKSIKTMMQGFIREDKLEGDNKYHCENCKSKANATKSFKILSAPPILTLHLKRFSVSYSSYGKPRANKNTQFVEYPESLDIAPYMVDTQSTNTRYRLFGVTCHRGAELRFGHYTSYVRGPSGAWYHADDEDMSPVSLKQVLNENTAYLLSYIRIGDPDQGPGARPTSTKSSPLPSRSINGHANGHTNGDGHVNGNGHGNGNGLSPSAASSPSMKRKRHWSGDDDDEESEAATPIARRSRLPTPPASSGDEYEEEEEEETQERTPVKWTYGGNKKQAINGIQAPRAQNPEALKKSPIDRPSHPGPASPQDSPRRKKDKRKKMKGGPPMPFNQGGGFRNRPGAISGMKGRQAGRANNRGVFRG